jgi:hypothetical protein
MLAVAGATCFGDSPEQARYPLMSFVLDFSEALKHSSSIFKVRLVC